MDSDHTAQLAAAAMSAVNFGASAAPKAKPTWRRDLGLALTGFVQVFLVAMNTVYIAKGNYPLAFGTSLGISYVWTRNVSRVAIGLERDRWLYAVGAACGCITGMALARALIA